MIHYKNEEQIKLMRQSALLVSKTLAEIAKILKPGITTLSIDKFIGSYIRDNNGIPSFLNYHGYPFNSCISVNDVVVHGFPNGAEPVKLNKVGKNNTAWAKMIGITPALFTLIGKNWRAPPN